MAQKNSEEDGGVEVRKIRIKQFNEFLDDYFNWIVAGIVVLVFVSGFFAVLLPKYQQTVALINSVNEQQSLNVTAKQSELDKINQLIASYNKIDKKYIDKVNAIAPLAQNKEELFSQLNYLVSVNQLYLESITLTSFDNYQDQNLISVPPSEKAIGDSLKTVNIALSVRGTTYESFKNLLSSLENNLRLMDVLSIKFDPGSQTTELVINTYYSKN